MLIIVKSLRKVFSDVRYVAIAVAGVFGFLAVSAILPNLQIIKWAIGSEAMAADKKLYFFANVLAGGFKIDLMSFVAFFTFTIAVLFGINIAMGIYSFSQTNKNPDPRFRGDDKIKSGGDDRHRKFGGAAGFFGAFAGFLGVGCSACGSVALSSFLSIIGVAGALSYLPLGGREFAILSIFLLLLSIYQISRNICTPQVCH